MGDYTNAIFRFFSLVILTQAFVYVVVVVSTRYIGVTQDGRLNGKQIEGGTKGKLKDNYMRPINNVRPMRSRGLIALAQEQLIGFDVAELRDFLEQNSFNDTLFDVIIRKPNHTTPFVILTATNKDFISITENFLESLRRQRMRYNITLMAEDEESYDYFCRRSNSEFHVVSSKQFTLPGKLSQNISSYQHLIRRRTVYILTLLRSGRDVLLVDVDAIWLKDPLSIIFSEYRKYDAWIAQGIKPKFPCPCFFYMKSVKKVINLVYDWIARVAYFDDGRALTDQEALAGLLDRNRQGVHFKYLDYEQFPIGTQFFNWTWNKEHHDGVYIAHGNHLGREQGKIETFREFGTWLLDN